MTFKKSREQYNYPTAHLRCKDGLSSLKNYVYVRPLEQIQGQDKLMFSATKQLDEYHNELLTSDDSESIILGVASVQYWGTYYNKKKPNHGLARSRVKRILKGNARSNKSIETLGKEVISSYVKNARELISNEKYGQALTEITKILLDDNYPVRVRNIARPYLIGCNRIEVLI